jgi:hypothetical protein
MKLTLKELKSLIKEVAAQAPSDAPFGQYAWPKERNLPVDEPDTKIEQEFLNVLYNAVEMASSRIPSQYIVALKQCLDNGYYTKMLKPPHANKIYRGVLVNADFIAQFDPNVDIEQISGGNIKVNAVIKSQGSYSCWTTEKHVACDYANNVYHTGNKVFDAKAILVASVSENNGKLIDLRPFNDNKDFNKEFPNIEEREVLAIGDVKIERLVYINKFEDLTDNF